MHHVKLAQARWARALTTARYERGWTHQQVADRLAVSPVTVSRWERGIHRPYAYHVYALCTLFGKTREELGFEAEPATPRHDEIPQALTDAHIVVEYMGLSCCFQGWIASLEGHNDQAECYLRLAADAFAHCQSPFVRVLQVLRGALALRTNLSQECQEPPQQDPGEIKSVQKL